MSRWRHPSGEPWPWGREPREVAAEICVDFARLLVLVDAVFLWYLHDLVTPSETATGVPAMKSVAVDWVAVALLLVAWKLIGKPPTLRRAAYYVGTVAAMAFLPPGPPGLARLFTPAILPTYLPEAYVLAVAGVLYGAAFLFDGAIYSRPGARPGEL